MNDLAEKALQGLDAARRHVRDHPTAPLAISGLLLASVVVVTGGRVGAARPDRPLTTWFGLEDAHGIDATDEVPGTIMLAALVALVVLWIVAVEVVRRTAPQERRVWWIAGAWAAPFALGPPLMDTTAQSYVAYGLLQRIGSNPYDVGAAGLGGSPVVDAVSPEARGTPSAAGPLGTLVQHLAVSVSAGNALVALVVIRALGVLVTIWIGRLAADMGGTRRAQALSLCVLNPLVLLYLVSSAHLDALMIAFLLASVGAANQRRWWTSIAFACLAGGVCPQGYVALPIILSAHWFGRRPPNRARLVRNDLVVAAAVVALTCVVQWDWFGWVTTITDQFAVHTPFGVTGLLGDLLSAVVHAAPSDDVAAGARVTAATGAVVVLAYLVWTARRRALERSIGYALLALGLLAPVLYPWYVLWGCLLIAPTALGARRIWVLALCAAGCALAPAGFSSAAAHRISAGLLTAVAVGTVAFLWLDARRERHATVSAGS